ncbi:MAG: 50S ribosomal protein L11 methyltransferase [Chloroflexi bacterium]|nr:MAG: 50S ribosomal protein L11 methyltransferase [Chloroflexota bacterium]
MDWIEVSLRVDSAVADAVSDLLQSYGHQGVVIEHDGIMTESWDDGDAQPPEHVIVRVYLPADEHAAQKREQLEAGLGRINTAHPLPTPTYNRIAETDWAEAWKAHYPPTRIGRRIFIRPQWVEAETHPDDIVIALDPGMAFGTGTHPTTQLCLEALEDLMPPATKILDLGCGSGILSLAAAKLGATHVHALDIDPIAVKVTRENAALNDVSDKITAQEGSLETIIRSSRRFDFAVVNILAHIIIALCGQGLGQVVRPGGKALFAGLIDTQADDVEAALRATGLAPYSRRQRGDWVLIEAYRPHEV